MANAKRDKNGYRKQLGRYRLSRANLLAIEKLLWEYADAREMKHANHARMPGGRKHMPRGVVDRYAFIGRYRPFHIRVGRNDLGVYFAGVNWIYQEDSVKFLSRQEYPKRTRYMELAAWPGIKLTITSKSTTIYAQTQYATGEELKSMKQVVSQLEQYLSKLPTSFFNLCDLRKHKKLRHQKLA